MRCDVRVIDAAICLTDSPVGETEPVISVMNASVSETDAFIRLTEALLSETDPFIRVMNASVSETDAVICHSATTSPTSHAPRENRRLRGGVRGGAQRKGCARSPSWN